MLRKVVSFIAVARLLVPSVGAAKIIEIAAATLPALALLVPVGRVSAQQLYLDPQFSVHVTNGIIYGTRPIGSPPGDFDLLLDLYEPVGAGVPAFRPGFIIIHGGGFFGGSRKDLNLVRLAHEMAARGYTAVSIDYRLLGQYPAVSWQFQSLGVVGAAVEDASLAHAWLLANASSLNVDVSRIAVGGDSAGSFTSLSLAYELDDIGVTSVTGIRAVMELWGAVDPQAIEAGEPPVIIVRGTEDNACWYCYGFRVFGEAIATRAAAVGIPFEFHPIAGAGHGFASIPIFSLEVSPGVTIFDRIVQFFYTHLGLSPTLDHFKCYKAKDLKNPKFVSTTVELADQFGVNDGSFEVDRPFLICNPTDKNGEGINNAADHLTCYRIKGPKLAKALRPKIEVVNQLGTLQLQAKKPSLLCVPSAKTVLP